METGGQLLDVGTTWGVAIQGTMLPAQGWLQTILVPICFVVAWGVVALIGWSLWAAMRDSIARARQMHRIPCSQCKYFTNSHLLKCSLHPRQALTEQAIDCGDFETADPVVTHVASLSADQ